MLMMTLAPVTVTMINMRPRSASLRPKQLDTNPSSSSFSHRHSVYDTRTASSSETWWLNALTKGAEVADQTEVWNTFTGCPELELQGTD